MKRYIVTIYFLHKKGSLISAINLLIFDLLGV